MNISKRMGLTMLLGALALLSACATPMGNYGGDSVEIKDKLDRTLANQKTLNNKIELLGNQMSENNNSQRDSMQSTLDDIYKMLRAQSEDIQKLKAQMDALAYGPRPGGAAGAPAPAPGSPAPAPAAPAPAGTGVSGASSASQAIANAMSAYQAGNFQAAREGFRQALSFNPGPEQKIECLFYLAESSFKMNELDQALTQYNDVIQAQNKHPKAWASVERMAEIKIRQNKPQEALNLLQFIADKYPKYPEIGRVRAAIARIKSGAAAAPAETSEFPSAEQ